MELVQHRIVVPTHHSILNLFFIGDMHLGTHACDKGTLQRTIETIRRTPNSWVIGMGDFCECIIPSDRRRWRMGELDPELLEYVAQKKTEDIVDWQIAQVIKYFKPLKGRILGLLSGNHEDDLHRDTNRNIIPHIAEALGAKDYGSSAYIRLSVACERTDNRAQLPIKVFHSKYSGRTPGPMLNNLLRHMEYWHARIVVIGHSHRLLSMKIPGMRLTFSGPPELVQATRVLGVSGSFYRAYQKGSSYAERADYPPSLLGCLKVTYKIEGDELDIHG